MLPHSRHDHQSIQAIANYGTLPTRSRGESLANVFNIYFLYISNTVLLLLGILVYFILVATPLVHVVVGATVRLLPVLEGLAGKGAGAKVVQKLRLVHLAGPPNGLAGDRSRGLALLERGLHHIAVAASDAPHFETFHDKVLLTVAVVAVGGIRILLAVQIRQRQQPSIFKRQILRGRPAVVQILRHKQSRFLHRPPETQSVRLLVVPATAGGRIAVHVVAVRIGGSIHGHGGSELIQKAVRVAVKVFGFLPRCGRVGAKHAAGGGGYEQYRGTAVAQHGVLQAIEGETVGGRREEAVVGSRQCGGHAREGKETGGQYAVVVVVTG